MTSIQEYRETNKLDEQEIKCLCLVIALGEEVSINDDRLLPFTNDRGNDSDTIARLLSRNTIMHSEDHPDRIRLGKDGKTRIINAQKAPEHDIERHRISILRRQVPSCGCDGYYDNGCVLCTDDRLDEAAYESLTKTRNQ